MRRRIRRRGWRPYGPGDLIGDILGGVAEAITEEAIRDRRKLPRPERVSTFNKDGSVYVEFIWPNGAVITRRLQEDEIDQMADALDRFFDEKKPGDAEKP